MINSMVSINSKDTYMIPKFLSGSLLFGLIVCLNPEVCFAQDPPFTENLKAYFKFDGDLNSTYPEIIGSGSATLTTDRYDNLNSALEFDGIDDTFSFSVSDNLVSNFSICLRAKPSGSTSSIGEFDSGTGFINSSPQNPLLYANHGGSGKGFGIDLGTNALSIVHYGNGLYTTSLNTSGNFNSWANYSFITENNQGKVYQGRDLLKSGIPVGTITRNSFLIFGKNPPAAGDQYFSGIIDDLYIFDRVLSLSEVGMLWNDPPNNLSELENLDVNENLPIGTIIGEFNATDPDGDGIIFHLVNGGGGTNNDLFALETNGTLKTAVVFDHETNSGPFSILVQAIDDYNASTEGVFSVAVNDTAEFLVTLTSEGNGTALGAGEYDQNASVNLVATPSPGFVFIGWSGDYNSSESNTSFLINVDFNITASFGEDTSDLDNDGLSNYYELVVFDSNVSNPDTDGDGFSDFEENRTGLDPNQPNSDYRLLLDSALAEANISGFSSGLNWAYTNRKIYELNTSDELQFQYGYADGSQDALNFHLNDPSAPYTELELNASRFQAEQDQLSAIHNKLASGVGGLTYLQNLQRVSAPNAANWYYQPGMGWLWTNQDVYPLVYFADSNETGGPRWLYSIRLEDAPDGSYYDYLVERMIGTLAD